MRSSSRAVAPGGWAASTRARSSSRGARSCERALAAADGAAHRVVVGDPAPASVPSGVRVVREEPVYSGPASAVMAGVDALAEAGSTATWVFVLACDVVRSARADGRAPGRRGCGIRTPTDSFRSTRSRAARFWSGCTGCRALRAARDAIGEVADSSMKRLLEPLRLVEVPVGAGATADVDTPEQARGARHRASAGPEPTVLRAGAVSRMRDSGPTNSAPAACTGHRRVAVSNPPRASRSPTTSSPRRRSRVRQFGDGRLGGGRARARGGWASRSTPATMSTHRRWSRARASTDHDRRGSAVRHVGRGALGGRGRRACRDRRRRAGARRCGTACAACARGTTSAPQERKPRSARSCSVAARSSRRRGSGSRPRVAVDTVSGARAADGRPGGGRR